MVDAVGLLEVNWQLVCSENQFIIQRQHHTSKKIRTQSQNSKHSGPKYFSLGSSISHTKTGGS